MDSTTYFTLTLSHVPAEREDELTGFLFEMGAAGVQENLKFSQKDRRYLPEVEETELKELLVYFESRPDSEFLVQLAQDFPEYEIQLNESPLKDWLAEWKAQWKPFCLAENVWVVPGWEKDNFDDSGKEVLLIEPGMAFGTGTHATTQIASSLLLQAIEKYSPRTLVDVGTGSGILALLADKRNVETIYAYDNDPESHRVFEENREKNKAREMQWLENWGQALQGKVDFCVANIIDGVLIDLKPQFKGLKARHYIFTGILLEREEGFLSEMKEDWNLKTVTRLEKDEWVGFLMENSQ